MSNSLSPTQILERGEIQSLTHFLNEREVTYERDVLLKSKTWIKTGGIASYWITPNSRAQLIDLVRLLLGEGVEFEVVGSTSNLYFLNNYNPSVVISTLRINSIETTPEVIRCDCGVQLSKLSQDCVAKGYRGFSELVNIPGTIAAAIYGNSGWGKSLDNTVSSHLESVLLLDPSGVIAEISKKELRLTQRSSALKRDEMRGVIISAIFRVEHGDIKEEQERAQKAIYSRKTYCEPPQLNLGSVYAKWDLKKSIFNTLLSFATRVVRKLFGVQISAKFRKRILLTVHGYGLLSPYISDRVLNTFIWRDSGAPEMFVCYRRFMDKICRNLEIEIEIKGVIESKKEQV